MKRFFLPLFFIAGSLAANSQNTGFGTNTPNARVEIAASNMATPANQDGILIPRVNAFPAVNPGSSQNGMLIYLTTAAGAYPPGFYYWDNAGISWRGIGWGLSGNAGTNVANHFIGTTDNKPLNFRVNNVAAGKISIGNWDTFFGYQSGMSISGVSFNNVGIGTDALRSFTAGNSNTALGAFSLSYNQTGSNNTAIGTDALNGNLNANYNIAVGGEAMYFHQTGGNNTSIGFGSGTNNISGIGNIFLGYQAGYNEPGSNKLYIQNSDANASNALIYGEFDNKTLRFNSLLEIYSNHPFADGLKVTKNYTAGTNQDKIAVHGQNTVDDKWGIGVQGNGGFIGVNGICTGVANGGYYGVRGISNGNSTGTNFGVYGNALNGTTNYSGYFETNTYVGGNLGVGVGAPATKLAINGGNGEAFTIFNGGDVRIYNDAGNASVLFYASGGSGANNSVFTILSDGKTFTFNGTGGSVSSDTRLKKDIQPIEGSIGKLMQLTGYSYRFKSKANIANKEIGVLAQEVQKVLPEAVFTNEDGTLSVSYNSLVPLLINGMKDQQHIIVSQEDRIKKLEEQVKVLIEKKN